VRIYDCVADLTRDLEEPDIRNGLYSCYDREGRKLSLVLGPRRKMAARHVDVTRAEETPSHQEALRGALSYWLSSYASREVPPNASLEELVREARLCGAEASAFFEERQFLRDNWLVRYTVVFFVVVSSLVVGTEVWEEGYHVLWVFAPALLPSFLLLLVFGTVNLHTWLDSRGLYVTLFPLVRKPRKLSLENVRSIVPGSRGSMSFYIKSLRRFDGWGVLGEPRLRAYNLGIGGRVVFIYYESGHSICIGSQKPEELEEAIRKWLETSNDQAVTTADQ
jgi:hypothetical protein